MLGEYVGGILLILFSWLFVRLTRPKRLIESARAHLGEPQEAAEDLPEWQECVQKTDAWRKVGKCYRMGFGNPARSDDGVGCYVIEQLRDRYADTSAVSLFDMGTAAFEVLFQLRGHDRILLVDAVVNTRLEVGLSEAVRQAADNLLTILEQEVNSVLTTP